MFNWEIYIQAFLLGAFPWVSQLRKLDIHFDVEGLDIKSISNFFASIFAISIFLFIEGTLPKTLLVNFLNLFWFIGIALISTLAFFIVFIYWRNEVKTKATRWPVILNFVLYLIIFSSLTTGFGILKVETSHFVLSGLVVDKKDGKGIPRASLQLKDVRDIVIASDRTDSTGSVLLLIPREKIKSINRLNVNSIGYPEMRRTIRDYNLIEDLINPIELDKEQ